MRFALDRQIEGLARARRDALHGLAAHLRPEQMDAARRCASALYDELPHKRALGINRVLVAYGGGKDSSYTLAFVRCMQLVLAEARGATFCLRVVTNRHAGMPAPVMHNIDRAYRALGVLEDPDCEALLVDAGAVAPFRADRPLPASLVQQNRDDILMTGHRTRADARPTFCNACNFSMVSSFATAAAHDGGVDIIITGDSRTEQRAYYVWATRLARQFGAGQNDSRGDFGGFLSSVRKLSERYFRDLHGDRAPAALLRRHLASENVDKPLRFFSIYGATEYASGQHWALLTQHLGFQFDEVAFAFSESDCANPAIMAHLRGLKCERVYGRSYEEGITEYIRFAIDLMRRKEFPQELIDVMLARYDGDDKRRRMRAAMDRLAVELYGLDEEQLVCMVHSPFAGRCRNLDVYLAREQPDLLPQAARIRELLTDADGALPLPDAVSLVERLERVSGLRLAQLRVLSGSALHPDEGGGGPHLIEAILARDPHKQTIETRHAPGGPVRLEVISGR
jgi:hypothetical protein